MSETFSACDNCEADSFNKAASAKDHLIHSYDVTLQDDSQSFQIKAYNPQHSRENWRHKARNWFCCFAPRRFFYHAPHTRSTSVLGAGATLSTIPSARSLEPAIGPVAQTDAGKLTVVLDLDETLVHSSFEPVDNADFVIPIEIDGEIMQVYVIKRPWLDYFIEQVGHAFEVVVFTASLAKYADAVLDIIDKHRVVRWRLYRDSCCPYMGNFVKDLRCLGRQLERVVLVDNAPHSYIFQPENALPSATFIDDPEDRGLLDILSVLLRLGGVEDVRKDIVGACDAIKYRI